MDPLDSTGNPLERIPKTKQLTFHVLSSQFENKQTTKVKVLRPEMSKKLGPEVSRGRTWFAAGLVLELKGQARLDFKHNLVNVT